MIFKKNIKRIIEKFSVFFFETFINYLVRPDKNNFVILSSLMAKLKKKIAKDISNFLACEKLKMGRKKTKPSFSHFFRESKQLGATNKSKF